MYNSTYRFYRFFFFSGECGMTIVDSSMQDITTENFVQNDAIQDVTEDINVENDETIAMENFSEHDITENITDNIAMDNVDLYIDMENVEGDAMGNVIDDIAITEGNQTDNELDNATTSDTLNENEGIPNKRKRSRRGKANIVLGTNKKHN